MKSMQERIKDHEAKYEEILKLGDDNGLRISLQWDDCEREVHSWKAVAMLMGKKESTVRVYKSRSELKGAQLLKHPDWPHHFSNCRIEIMQEARRGPPHDPAKKAAAEASQDAKRQQKREIKRLELEARRGKLEISLNLIKVQLEQL